jgi:hypothetical protein
VRGIPVELPRSHRAPITDTVGHALSTRHGYYDCVGFSMFLGLQRQHMRGTIFGIWGMTNSIRADTVGQPPSAEIRVSNMPALKAKKLGKLP